MAASIEWTAEQLLQLLNATKDDASGVLGIIDFEHHEIHDGDSFVCHFSNTVTNTGEMTVIAFNTPDTTRWIHVVVEYTATALARALLVEDPSIDVDEGGQLLIFNRDRNSAKESLVSSIEAVPDVGEATSYNEAQAAGANITITAGRTVSEHHIGGVGVGPGGTSGSQLQRNEYILRRNTQYAIILEALNDDTNIHNLHVSWYEHANR